MALESPLCNIVKVDKISSSNKSVDKTYTMDITCKVAIQLPYSAFELSLSYSICLKYVRYLVTVFRR